MSNLLDAMGNEVDAADVAGDARAVELLAEIEPGPLAMMLLAGIEVSALDEGARIDVAAAWERQQSWVAARAQAALAEVVAVPVRASEMVAAQEWRAELVAASLRWSPMSAANRLEVADRLVRHLPLAFGLLTAGDISFRHAWVLADAVAELLPAEMMAVEAKVVERAPSQTVAQFRRSVRRAVIEAAPEFAAAQHANAVRARGVRRVAYPDGMAAVVAVMPAADAETVYLALDADARKTAAEAGAQARTTARTAAHTTGAVTGDEMPIDARRADALLAWAQQALAAPGLPTRQGRRVEVQVVIDLPTLLGLADNPAELVGYGPITAGAACALAADARWRRLVVDPVTGCLLDYGTRVYRPPQELVDYVVARDRHCRFPGCHRRADTCDVDHVHPAGKGGKTAARNCAALCRKHHRMKTLGGWRYVLHDNDAVTWTAPNGRTFHADRTGQLN